MPELPEVETVKNGLTPFIKNEIITGFTLNRPNLRFPIPPSLPETLRNKSVTSLSRHGKSMIWHIEDACDILWHLGMSGSFRASSKDKAITKKHDHVVVETADNLIIFNDPRRFGSLGYAPKTLKGVDPYSDAYSFEILYPLFKSRHIPIKTALLNQSLITGIGNIYACEALFYTGLRPTTPCHRISKARYERLFIEVKRVLDAAIASGGSSLKDHVMVNGDAGYFQHTFAVYDRENQKCITCDNTIKKFVMSGRATYACLTCQK